MRPITRKDQILWPLHEPMGELNAILYLSSLGPKPSTLLQGRGLSEIYRARQSGE
jgi:hypothetical protein